MIFCVYSMNTTCWRSVYAYHGGLFWPHICLTFTLTWLMNVLWNVCLPVCPCLCQRAGVLLLPVGWCTPSTLSERSPACRKGLQRMEAEERESLDQYPVLVYGWIETADCKKQPLPLPYPPLPAQAPPAGAQSYTPSLWAAPGNFPTMSPPSMQRVHGATCRERAVVWNLRC